MQARLYANLSTKQLSPKLTQGTWTPPKQRAGDVLVFRLLLSELIDGSAELATRTVSSVKASLGRLDARPVSGAYTLTLDGIGTTAEISYAATAAQIKAAIDAIDDESAAFPVSVTEDNGAFRILFADQSAQTITADANTLWPVSFVTVTSAAFDEGTQYVLRLVQTPLAAATTFDEVMPDPPVISRKQAGTTDTGVARNEIQKLTLPPDYTGGFQLKNGFRKSRVLTLPIDLDTVETALNEDVADPDAGESFRTLEGAGGNALYIEFTGSFAGEGQSLLEVVEFDAPAPEIKITLDTRTTEMWARMRDPDNTTTLETKVPLNLTLYLEDLEDPETDIPLTWSAEIPFFPPVNFEADNVAAGLDWNLPLSHRDTRVFAPSQILTGHRNYEEAIGDGAATSFAINHNLAAAGLHVTVRENTAGGDRVPDNAYTLTYDSDNACTLSGFGHTLTADEYIVHISSIAHEATYSAHEHSIAQIYSTSEGDEGLESRLAALEEAVSALQAQSPAGTPLGALPGTPSLAYRLPDVGRVLPLRLADQPPLPDTLAGWDPVADGIRFPALRPAVHDASLEALSTILSGGDLPAPSDTYLDKVYHVDTVPGNSTAYLARDYVACSGAGGVFYRVSRYGEGVAQSCTIEADDETVTTSAAHGLLVGDAVEFPALVGGTGLSAAPVKYWVASVPTTTTLTVSATPGGSAVNVTVDATSGTKIRRVETGSSYYPSDMEVTLAQWDLTDKELTLRSAMEVTIGFEAAAYFGPRRPRERETELYCALVLECATPTEDASPGTPGGNLATVPWGQVLISHAFRVTRAPTPHYFAARLERKLVADVDTLELETQVERLTVASDEELTLPLQFRCRLIRWDTRNAIGQDARGLVAIRGLRVGLDGKDSDAIGQVTVG